MMFSLTKTKTKSFANGKSAGTKTP